MSTITKAILFCTLTGVLLFGTVQSINRNKLQAKRYILNKNRPRRQLMGQYIVTP